MRHYFVSELIMMNQMNKMDCRTEGSMDDDCDCDAVDGK